MSAAVDPLLVGLVFCARESSGVRRSILMIILSCVAQASTQSMLTDWYGMGCKLRIADEDGTRGLVADYLRSRRGDDGKKKR